MSEKIIGYLLLFAGIGLMIFATYRVYGLLTEEKNNLTSQVSTQQVQLQQTAPSIDLSNIEGLENLQMQNTPSLNTMTNPLSLLSAIPGLTNTLASIITYFLMLFLLNLGFKISSLGIMLIRPINVRLKTNSALVTSDTGTTVQNANT